jgi:hypothetical protein
MMPTNEAPSLVLRVLFQFQGVLAMPRLSFLAFGLLIGIELSPARAHAGPPMPCIVATLSPNGGILVVNELTYDDPDETHVRYFQTSTFRVLRRYVDINEGLRLNGPNAYWAHPLWSVVFTRSGKPPLIGCPYTLVTDDGEYLILVGDFFQQTALSIYRRRDHPGQPFGGPGPDHGVLVRQIPLSDLWPPERIPETMTDHTPQWFASGTFAFSPDNRTLIHKTRWGKSIAISLETGEIKGQ